MEIFSDLNLGSHKLYYCLDKIFTRNYIDSLDIDSLSKLALIFGDLDKGSKEFLSKVEEKIANSDLNLNQSLRFLWFLIVKN